MVEGAYRWYEKSKVNVEEDLESSRISEASYVIEGHLRRCVMIVINPIVWG